MMIKKMTTRKTRKIINQIQFLIKKTKKILSKNSTPKNTKIRTKPQTRVTHLKKPSSKTNNKTTTQPKTTKPKKEEAPSALKTTNKTIKEWTEKS